MNHNFDLLKKQLTRWEDPLIVYYKNFYNFLNYVDPSKVQFVLNMCIDTFDRLDITKNIFIVSTYVEGPRIDALVKFAKLRTDVQFICLADSEVYDFPLPPNVTFFKYRHYHIFFNIFLQNGLADYISPVKSKKYLKKFSSLSNFRKQNRALVTACLLTYAKHDSIISWHNRPWNDHHDYLISTLKNNSRYADLNWHLLENELLIDNYNVVTDNDYKTNILKNSFTDVYQTSLVNFSNETTSFGLYAVEDTSYIRPGPFLTEKTWNPLLAGNILFSSAQPYVYQYLINDYSMPINYSFGLDFDNIPGDLDRFDAICKKIQELVNIPLTTLVDENIDNCELIQKTIMDLDYVQNIDQFNRVQDLKILEKISQIV